MGTLQIQCLRRKGQHDDEDAGHPEHRGKIEEREEAEAERSRETSEQVPGVGPQRGEPAEEFADLFTEGNEEDGIGEKDPDQGQIVHRRAARGEESDLAAAVRQGCGAAEEQDPDVAGNEEGEPSKEVPPAVRCQRPNPSPRKELTSSKLA